MLPQDMINTPSDGSISDQPVLLDWSKTATVGDPKPCITCRRPAILRNPDGRPQHKVCAEAEAARSAVAA